MWTDSSERRFLAERKKQGILYNLHLLFVFLFVFWCTVQWKCNTVFFLKENTFFLYKYVNIIPWLLSVVAVIELMLWLAHSSSVNTHGNMCYWKRRWCLSWIFHPLAPCSIQDSGSLVCGVFVYWDLIRYFVMLVKAHTKTSQGGWRIIVVQYLEDRRIWANKHSERTSSDWKDRQLPEFWRKLWKASQCYSNQVLPGHDWKPGPEESSTVLVTE